MVAFRRGGGRRLLLRGAADLWRPGGGHFLSSSHAFRSFASRFLSAMLLLAAAAVFLIRTARPPVLAQPAPAPGELRAVTLVFGQRRPAHPVEWHGGDRAGTIEKIEGYHFTGEAASRHVVAVRHHAWPAFPTRCGPRASAAASVSNHPDRRHHLLPRARRCRNPRQARSQGEFAFRPAELPEIAASIRCARWWRCTAAPVVEPSARPVRGRLPSIAVDGGKPWVAWQAYRDKADRIFLRASENGRWAARSKSPKTRGLCS